MFNVFFLSPYKLSERSNSVSGFPLCLQCLHTLRMGDTEKLGVECRGERINKYMFQTIPKHNFKAHHVKRFRKEKTV